MREHHVCCQISGDKAAANIQNEINIYTALYIKEYLGGGGFTKDEKIKMIDELINRLKASDIGPKGTDPSPL